MTKLNRVQSQYIKNYDKENQISEKINILTKEINQTKETIKDYQNKYMKLDKFIKLIHEKIVGIEMIIKKEKAYKEEPKKKLFTKEELKDTVELITSLKKQITEKRNQLNAITKQNDGKINKMLSQNKQIEIDYKEAEKTNKMLIFKRNELKRNIRNITVNGVNNSGKNKFKLNNKKENKNNNMNINNEINEENKFNEEKGENMENELENDAEFNEPNVNDNINNNLNEEDGQHKLFQKNPNKKFEEKENNNINGEEEGEEINNENIEQDNDAIENDNMNDSNLNMNENENMGDNNDNIEQEDNNIDHNENNDNMENMENNDENIEHLENNENDNYNE